MTQQEFEKRYTYHPDTDRLGEGGFGEVFKAYDNYRDRWVAIKIAKVKPGLETVRLQKEVEMVNNLPVHPNIAYYEECHTFSSFAGEYDFGILQFYEAGNLQQLAQRTQLTPMQKEAILIQLLEGIGFLHEHGIIHRDLKPANILMVNRNGEYIPKITDFGISKQLDINKSSVFNNSLAGAGTLSYASPEQLGDRTIRKNTDLWSFGVIAYWLLTGKLPFNTGSHATTSEAGRAELFRQISQGQLPAEANTLPGQWPQVVEACLVVDPERRAKKSTTCLEMLQGKKPAVQEAPPTTFDPPAPPPTRVEPAREKPTPKPNPNPNPNPRSTPSRSAKPVVWKYATIALAVVVAIIGIRWLITPQAGTIQEKDGYQPSENTAFETFTETVNGVSFKMVAIKGGTFEMGSEDGDADEKPVHAVTVSDFYMGETEVTQALWKALMGNSPSYFKGDELPVEKVSWNDVQEFITKLNRLTGKSYKLPTEAEWEYAAGGGATNRTQWAGTNSESSLGSYAWYINNSNSQTHPVGTRSSNGLGLYDMSGNVWERCSDWYGEYSSGSQTNPGGSSSGSYRVNRGGGWSYSPARCRVAYRSNGTPNNRSNSLGFRVALAP